MSRKQKKIGIIIAIVLLVIVASTFALNLIIENKIATVIDDLPKSVKVEYQSIDVNVWTGNLELASPKVVVSGKTTNKTILDATLKTIEINNLGYWDYLFNDKISVETLIINRLVATYKHNPKVNNDDYEKGFLNQIKQIIAIEKIAITNAGVLITEYDTDSTLLSMPKFNFELNDVQINPKASKKDKKIRYGNFTLAAMNLKWTINEFDDLWVNSIQITNDNATFSDFKLKTKYDKAEYSEILKTERDHFDLHIDEVKFLDMNFGFNDDKTFYFKSGKVLLNSLKAEIYRDKLVADDETYKKLYGTLLRDLDFELGLNSVEIRNGKVSYLEKVNVDEKAGRLDFTAMNAIMTNVGNTYLNESTLIKVNSTFMENSSIEVNWNFKVADTTDQFVFKADLGLFEAVTMDQFTKPNLNVDLNGELQQTYFTISGNPSTSRIDMKMKYDDFEVLILKKDGKEKNKFLSTIVNLFISKDSDDEKKVFRYGQAEGVERDVTKSVFNYVWLNIRSGLLSVMTGDGKKEN